VVFTPMGLNAVPSSEFADLVVRMDESLAERDDVYLLI
jgi:hypothetical protein